MFGTRARAKARRRTRLKRVVIGAWIATTVATVLGLPVMSPTALLAATLHRGQAQLTRSSSIETSRTTAAMMRFQRGLLDARLTPSPSPTSTSTTSTSSSTTVVAQAPASAAPAAPAPAPAGSVSQIIYSAADEFGLGGSYLLSVASCESGLNPNAYNSAGYYGLFQFDQTTWGAYGYGSIYDPTAQARTAARLLAAGQSSRWPNCA
jgi:soluble lytic murein transglycosylase-like protein